MQADLIQIGTGGVLIINTACLLRLAYVAGQWAEKLLNMERRLLSLETKVCPHGDCPVRARLELEETG